MFIEKDPFPYLKSGQYAGLSNGEIVILDKTIPKDKVEQIKAEYKKWWKKRQREMIEDNEI